MQVEAPRVVAVWILVRVNQILNVAAQSILGGYLFALAEVVNYLVVQLIDVIDLSGLRYELQVVDEGVLLGILVPASLQKITRQVAIVTSYEYPLVCSQSVFLSVSNKCLFSKEGIHQELLLVLLLLLFCFCLLVV